MKLIKCSLSRMTTMVMISTTVLSFLAVFSIGNGTAFALAEMDRMRCQVDAGFDVLGNPLNQVQIQVKIDGPDMLDVWVVNPTHSSGFPAVSPMHTNVPSIGGTVSVDWDSAPDPDPITGLIPGGVLVISGDFVANGDKIVAHARYVTTLQEIATMEAGCAWKISAQFRQQTKPTAAEKAAAKSAAEADKAATRAAKDAAKAAKMQRLKF